MHNGGNVYCLLKNPEASFLTRKMLDMMVVLGNKYVIAQCVNRSIIFKLHATIVAFC